MDANGTKRIPMIFPIKHNRTISHLATKSVSFVQNNIIDLYLIECSEDTCDDHE